MINDLEVMKVIVKYDRLFARYERDANAEFKSKMGLEVKPGWLTLEQIEQFNEVDRALEEFKETSSLQYLVEGHDDTGSTAYCRTILSVRIAQCCVMPFGPGQDVRHVSEQMRMEDRIVLKRLCFDVARGTMQRPGRYARGVDAAAFYLLACLLMPRGVDEFKDGQLDIVTSYIVIGEAELKAVRLQEYTDGLERSGIGRGYWSVPTLDWVGNKKGAVFRKLKRDVSGARQFLFGVVHVTSFAEFQDKVKKDRARELSGAAFHVADQFEVCGDQYWSEALAFNILGAAILSTFRNGAPPLNGAKPWIPRFVKLIDQCASGAPCADQTRFDLEEYRPV